MYLKPFLFINIILLIKNGFSYNVDIYCPEYAGMKDSCHKIFSNSNIIFEPAIPRVVSKIADVKSEIIFDLSRNNTIFPLKSYTVFYPTTYYSHKCDNKTYYSLAPIRSLKNRICLFFYIIIVIEVMSIENRSKYVILGEESAYLMQVSLVNYLTRLKRDVLLDITTDYPYEESIISQLQNIDNNYLNETVVILLYINPNVIEEMFNSKIIQLLINQNIKIITFNVINEEIIQLNPSIYKNTYVVNGYYNDLYKGNDIIIKQIQSDTIFITYNNYYYVYFV